MLNTLMALNLHAPHGKSNSNRNSSVRALHGKELLIIGCSKYLNNQNIQIKIKIPKCLYIPYKTQWCLR